MDCRRIGNTRIRQSYCGLAFWLTHLQPETQCPIILSRNVFEQLAVDLPHMNQLGDLVNRRAQIRAEWNRCFASSSSKSKISNGIPFDSTQTRLVCSFSYNSRTHPIILRFEPWLPVESITTQQGLHFCRFVSPQNAFIAAVWD